MGIRLDSRSALLAVAAAMLACAPVRAQWPSEDMEVVYRNGRREVVNASPFIGVERTEILGGSWRIARSELAMVCFAHIAPKGRTMEPGRCPKELPGEVAEDTVLWNDGTKTTGAVTVGGYQEGESVRQAGHPSRARQEAVSIQFASGRTAPSRSPTSDMLDHIGSAAAGLPPRPRPQGD